MENIIINGDLYIKIAPTIIYKNTPIKKTEMSELEIMDLLSQNIDMKEISNILNNIDKFMEEKAKQGEIKREKIEEYDHNIGFYKIFVSKEAIFLISEYDATGNVILPNISSDCENLYEFFEKNQIPNNVFDYYDIKEAKEDFIRFYDFLANANFVGHYLEPKFTNIPRYKVLYEFLENYLIQNVSNDDYTIISKKHPLINNYIKGKNFDNTFDKTNIYQEVFKQKITNSNGNTRKK